MNHNPSKDSSSLPESLKADEQPSRPSPTDLEKSWLKILGRKDYLRGDLKMEGNWNITYNETQIASPVIMLVRPQHFIYLSIRPALGIEMLRIILRPDSLWMISRLNKNYWSCTCAELEPSLGMSLDYRWFQDALLHGHRSLIDRAVLGVYPHHLPGNSVSALKTLPWEQAWEQARRVSVTPRSKPNGGDGLPRFITSKSKPPAGASKWITSKSSKQKAPPCPPR
ncbi:MAG: DUF4292 domain-containing protein [Bacteroidota bacterium]